MPVAPSDPAVRRQAQTINSNEYGKANVLMRYNCLKLRTDDINPNRAPCLPVSVPRPSKPFLRLSSAGHPLLSLLHVLAAVSTTIPGSGRKYCDIC